MMFQNVYEGCKVLVTGHTGFKGSWLVAWLDRLGAQVTGLSLDPSGTPSHWDALRLRISRDHRSDIRETEATSKVVQEARPSIVFHLAAQPLVRQSYRDPLETWSTNMLGTASLLEACRMSESVKAIVVVTTDKVYANQEWSWGYREFDALGGHDPYSASKACCELIADSYRKAFFGPDQGGLLATVRAGNVIGGGDWSDDRLIPDLVRSSVSGEGMVVRSPQSTRPWQHVLDCLCGYLIVGQRLLQQDHSVATAWNFGPSRSDNRPVIEILQAMQSHWPEVKWQTTKSRQPHEARLLYLDNSKATDQLDWRPVWTLQEALQQTAEWYKDFYDRGKVLTEQQIELFVRDAVARNNRWACG